MSWVEQIQERIEITTGDGQVYSPDYMGVVKKFDYNIAEFEFINVEGTRVERGTAKGTRHEIKLIFQGENNIDDARDFENSSKDRRVWTIQHPIHGRLRVHPINLTFDFDGLNVCEVTGTVVETIEDDYPQVFQDPKGKSNANVEIANESIATSFTSITLAPNDVAKLKNTNDKSYSFWADKIKSSLQFNEYFNLYKKANVVASVAIDYPLQAINEIQLFLMYPALLEESVSVKLGYLKVQFETLIETVTNIVTPNDKKILETQAGTLINAVVYAVTNPLTDEDYQNADDVLSVLDSVFDLYGDFVSVISGLQTSTGSQIDGFVPDSDSQLNINFAVNFIVSQLLSIALSARQQRTLVLNYPSNAIILAHRLYGLSPDDSTIKDFIQTNNLSMDELIQIPANKQIVYYV